MYIKVNFSNKNSKPWVLWFTKSINQSNIYIYSCIPNSSPIRDIDS